MLKSIDEAHANARKLLEQYKDQVILIAETLLEKETITAEEIEYLCKNGHLPEADKPANKPAEEPKKEEEPAPAAPTESKIEEPKIPEPGEAPEPKDSDESK